MIVIQVKINAHLMKASWVENDEKANSDHRSYESHHSYQSM